MNDSSTVASVTAKRPLGVWLITIFFGISATWTLLSSILLYEGLIPMSDEMRIYYHNLPLKAWALPLGLTALTLTSAVTLFRLRRAAVPIFIVNFMLNISMLSWQVFKDRALIHVVPKGGYTGAYLGSFLIGTFALYVWRLYKKGMLR